MTATPEQVTLTKITHTYQIDGQPLAKKTLLFTSLDRRITHALFAHELAVTTYPDNPGLGHILIEGQIRQEDGTPGRFSGAGWVIGGERDQSADVPAWAMRIAEPLIGSSDG